MALAWTTVAQDRVAYLLFNQAYTGLSTAQKNVIDGNWTSGALTAGVAFSAFTIVQQIAQWWEQGGSSVTTDYAMSWLIDETLYRASVSLRPERVDEYKAQRESSRLMYLQSITPTELTSGLSTGVYAPSPQSIRFHVLNNTITRTPPVLIRPEDIDSALFWVNNSLWNQKEWNFRKRQLSARIVPFTITGGDWTESNKTISGIDTTNYVHVAGAYAIISGATGVVPGVYKIASASVASSGTIVLVSSLSADGGNLTGVVSGTAVTFNVYGLPSGETLDSVSSRSIFYVDQYQACTQWDDATQLARRMSDTTITAARPARFRIERNTGTLTWFFWPTPDAAYNMRFEGLIALPGTSTPGVPTSATDTVPYAKYPQEFKTVLKELVLGKILRDRGITPDVWKNATDEVDKLAPVYDDHGNVDVDSVARDVYADVQGIPNPNAWWGNRNMLGGTM